MSTRRSRKALTIRILLPCVVLFASISAAGGQDMSTVPAANSPGVTIQGGGFLSDSVASRRRPRAIEYSDWYSRRLMIHRIGSYTMLPLFATQYYLGERLLDGRASASEKDIHVAVATGIGALFTINTVTGVWNLWDSRKDPEGRRKRLVHSALMIGSEAGFALAASIDDKSGSNTHRNIALTSMGVSTVGAAMMWFFR